MLDLISGLPVHPLVVHAVVVLLALATLGTASHRHPAALVWSLGPLVFAAAVVATVQILVTT